MISVIPWKGILLVTWMILLLAVIALGVFFDYVDYRSKKKKQIPDNVRGLAERQKEKKKLNSA